LEYDPGDLDEEEEVGNDGHMVKDDWATIEVSNDV